MALVDTVALPPPLEMPFDRLGEHADALDRMLRGELLGLIVRGVYQPSEMALITGRLERGECTIPAYSARPYFEGVTYGRPLVVAGADLGPYFADAARVRAGCAGLFAGVPDFEARIEEVLGRLCGGRAVALPPGPTAGAAYQPATLRELRAGGEIALHCENETASFPAMRHLASILDLRRELSYYLTLSVPETGGELVCHAVRHGEGEGGELLARMERTGEPTLRAIAPWGARALLPGAGDLLIFDGGRYFHRVSAVGGSLPRYTIGGFLALSRDHRTVHFWG